MLDAVEIHQLYKARQRELYTFHAAANMFQEVYEGKLAVPLPEIDKNEMSATANLIQTGLDQHAMRIASVEPQIQCPPLRASNTAIKRANQRKLTFQAWWYMNNMSVKRGFRARHLAGFGMSPVLIRPGPDNYPVWEVRSPLETFPAPTPQDEMLPADCIFAFERDCKWVKEHYPDFAVTLGRNRGRDEKIKLLQFVSEEQYSLVAIGRDAGDEPNSTPFRMSDGISEPSVMMLGNVPNRAGVPCVVIPGRITLANLSGQFDQLIGMYAAGAKLWALQIHAVMREVFGETWVQATAQGGLPEIVTQADPYEGTVGVVRDGQIQQFRVQSSQGPLQAIDRLERNQRVSGAIPSEMGGESSSNVRTGRRGGQVFAAAVDFYVQEHQNLLANSLQIENDIAVEIAKAYWPDTPKTFIIPFAKGQVSYTPSVTFDTPKFQSNSVSYAYAGADTNSLVIEAGQRIAQGTLSKESFMKIDPMISDPNTEHDAIIKETIEQAVLQSILQQSADPASPWQPTQMGRLMELVYTSDIELWKAIETVQQEAQEAQAAQAEGMQSGPGGGMPEMMGAEMQPGLDAAGAPGSPQAAIQGANPSQANLGDLLKTLRQGGRGGISATTPPPGVGAPSA